MQSVMQAVLRRIRVHGRGWVFTPKNFVDIGNRGATDMALTRFTEIGTIRRLARGLYDYPRVHPKLGMLAPNPDEVAKALATKDGSRIQVSGARAANLLGLSDQVPAQIIYLTNGRSRRVRIGAQVISLKQAATSTFPAAGTPVGLALQALRALGRNIDEDFVVQRLAKVLTHSERQKLIRLSKYAPGWSRNIFRRLKEMS